MYDLVVVGAGCIGSSAARHASRWGRVCLIGPEEPQERSVTDTFGAHYDEGRITRKSDEDFVWSTLARESIDRYRELERLSGIDFYNEVGYIICGTRHMHFINSNRRYSKEYEVNVEYLTNKQLKQHFNFLNFSDTDEAIFEKDKSGFISPRRMIEAEIKMAKQNGCEVVRDVVSELERRVYEGRYVMAVKTESGQEILADKVLVATGGFTAFRKLLPSNLQADVVLHPVTVAKVEISDSDFQKIRNMPSISYSGTGADDWNRDFVRLPDNTIRFYMLPPVKYPDGKYYIKLGHYSEDYPKTLSTAQEVKDWYCSGGDAKMIQDTVALIKTIVKDINVLSYQGDCCVIVKTPSGRPYIDQIHKQLGVALGGNGCAAKSSDEIGRIAAEMIMRNQWVSSLGKELFRAKFKPNSVSKL